jgi:membrane protein DedA with SNARE-associated domain
VTEALLALVPVWGIWLVAAGTFLSCLALPVPSSLIMLAAGGFAAAGDLVLWQVAAAAWGGALAGDQTGYGAGRAGGRVLLERLRRRPSSAAALARAEGFVARRGGMAVFLSRWLVSPLGPYVNLLTGAAGLGWGRFTLADAAGEAVWVAIYVGLGFAFADRIAALADLLGNLSGLLAAGVVAAGLGVWLFRTGRRAGAVRPPAGGG